MLLNGLVDKKQTVRALLGWEPTETKNPLLEERITEIILSMVEFPNFYNCLALSQLQIDIDAKFENGKLTIDHTSYSKESITILGNLTLRHRLPHFQPSQGAYCMRREAKDV